VHRRLGAVTVLAAALLAALATPALAATGHQAARAESGYRFSGAYGALFVQTDNPAGNEVVAYHRQSGGTLTEAGAYATGGLGGILSGCPHCTEYIAQMRATIELSGRISPDDLTPQMREEFIALFRRWRAEDD
jgi:hypothetical protein